MERALSWEDTMFIQGTENKPMCLKQRICFYRITKVTEKVDPQTVEGL